MKRIRTLHTYLGTFFAPMILYFSVSGAWQVYRWNDLPRDPKAALEAPAEKEPKREEKKEGAGGIRPVLHELSLIHKESTAPGRDPDASHSAAFDFLAAIMSLCLAATTILGLILAVRFARNRAPVYSSFAAGIVLPIVFLYLF